MYLHKSWDCGTTGDMTSRLLPPSEVLPTSEARNALTQITAEFRDHGAASGLVIFGSRRRPEAAVVPYELIELLDPVIEDLVIAARARERLAEDDGTRFTVDEVAAEPGMNLDE
jgi:antitoxin StbD